MIVKLTIYLFHSPPRKEGKYIALEREFPEGKVLSMRDSVTAENFTYELPSQKGNHFAVSPSGDVIAQITIHDN